MKIGTRVAYDDRGLGDVAGTVVEPTDEDLIEAAGERAAGPEWGDVVVAWDDGERYWESPGHLVLLTKAGS